MQQADLEAAVREAIEKIGIERLRQMSCFGSNHPKHVIREDTNMKIAA